MKQTARRAAAILVAVAACAVASVGLPYSTAAAAGPSNTLSVGQTLRPSPSDPGGSAIVSANSEYQLGIYYNARTPTSGGVGLEIDQFGPVVGAGLWTQGGRATPQAYAVLRRNGNFVLYARPGVAIWSTHTAGTGSNNRLVMQDDGNLVMYTAAGRAVWSSRTHAEVLSSGDRLLPGQRLTNVYSHSDPPTTLSMQRDGDLVLRFHGAVVWASNTSVHGSYLLMQPDGDLVIRSDGHTLWRSRTGSLATPADGRPFLDVKASGRFTVNFTPPDGTGGPAARSVFDSTHRPGEAGRVADGAMLFMTTGSVLHPGQSLVSRTGYRLGMHSDGNLVQRGPHGAVRWQTHTAGHPGALLELGVNGNLVLHRGKRVLWTTGTDTGDYRHRAINFVMQANGNEVAHGPTGLRLWVSDTIQ
jgi:hypothetical protein